MVGVTASFEVNIELACDQTVLKDPHITKLFNLFNNELPTTVPACQTLDVADSVGDDAG